MNEKRETLEFTIPARLRDKLQHEAERQGITLEEYVTALIEARIKSDMGKAKA